jgi:hypothetical protein
VIAQLSGCGAPGGNNSTATPPANGQGFSCPTGQSDVMQYFAMMMEKRQQEFTNGQPNPVYSEVFPDQDFAASGYWLWLKSASAHGFDVKAFDQSYVYIRSMGTDFGSGDTINLAGL